jgi:hypothetical protein
MAIKLADVIERSHVSFPVIEAHDKTIVGFYNGASGNAQQSLKLYYNSSVKTKLTSDGTSGNSVKLTSLPYGADGGANTAGPGDARVVPTERGGLLTMIDEKLLTDAQGQSSGYTAAYLVNLVTQGSSSDTSRDSLGRLSELVQQFNRYPSITGTLAAAQDDANNFYFAGYHDTDKAHKKITLTELAGGLAGIIGQELVSNGVITIDQASSSGGSGLLGDINGDGVVSVADFLLLNQYLNDGVTGFTALHTIMSESDEEGALFTPVAIGTNSAPFTLSSDFSDWSVPSSFTVNGEAFGFTGINIPSGSSANFIEFTGLDISAQFMSNYYGQYRVKIYTKVVGTYMAPDILYAVAEITLTYDDASSTEETHAYLMYSASDGNINLGAPSEYFVGSTAGVPLAEPTEILFGLDLAGQLAQGGNFLFSVGTVNDTDSLANGFTMNRTVEGLFCNRRGASKNTSAKSSHGD